MSKTIEISSTIFSRLEQHAKGFDTPANVIEKLLNKFEEVSSDGTGRDYTKYRFNGDLYGKRGLVLAVVKDYIFKNQKVTYEELNKIFPKKIQGSIGVLNKLKDVKIRYKGKNSDRHYTNKEHILHTSDAKIVVCTQWGIGNFNTFLDRAREIGFEIISE
ncbi:MAG: hypothetical protein L3J51_09245 [Cocleimonas sp.]|nr:hypothetical protein [Cocleimonas sp.]